VPGHLEPLAVDPEAGGRFAARAVEVRALGGREPEDWPREFQERLRSGTVNGRLYVVDGKASGLVAWSPGGPTGIAVHLLYASAEAAAPEEFARVLAAVEQEAGPVAYVAGPLAGLTVDLEDGVMRPLGYRRFGRSEMVFGADGEIVELPAPEGIRLRAAERRDLAVLAHLHRLAYRDRFDRFLFLEHQDETEDALAAVREILDGRWGEFSSTGSWIVERDGRPAGAVLSVRTAAGTLIADVVVEPKAQGGGLGRRLLVRALRSVRNAGGQKIYLNVTEGNERAIRLYGSVGFVRSLGPTRDWYNTRRIPVAPGPTA
jgi:ribosomal protein S18 acetylase RimI-like enzyme